MPIKRRSTCFTRFFATKSRHDSNATMAFISRDLSVYVDATLGWELHGYDALQAVWAHYMPTWGEGRSYPTRILGEVHGGTGSVMVEFTDTPELFGADMRVLGAVDVVDGKITRWADYWDSAAYDGKRFEKMKRPPVDPPLALRSTPAATSARIRDVSSTFVERLSSGDTEGAATLFSYDGVFEDRSLHMTIVGFPAIKRYLARVQPHVTLWPRRHPWACRWGRCRRRIRMGLLVFAGENRRYRPVDQRRRADHPRQHCVRQQRPVSH